MGLVTDEWLKQELGGLVVVLCVVVVLYCGCIVVVLWLCCGIVLLL